MCKVLLDKFLFDPGARLSESHLRDLLSAAGEILRDARVLQQHRPGEALRLQDGDSGHGLWWVRHKSVSVSPNHDVIRIVKLSLARTFVKGKYWLQLVTRDNWKAWVRISNEVLNPNTSLLKAKTKLVAKNLLGYWTLIGALSISTASLVLCMNDGELGLSLGNPLSDDENMMHPTTKLVW